jgi:site-specific DNA recombinase
VIVLASRRIAVYARYSSDRQSETSIEDQIARCTRWIVERGGAVDPALVFTDYAVSAASLARPGWEFLERRIADGGIDVIVVESLDRVSRKVADTAHLLERLRFKKVQLVGVADATDTSSSSALVHTTIKGLFGEMFLADLADKTRRGMEGRARAGMATGGLPFGYVARETDRGHAIEIDPVAAAVVRRIFRMHLDGSSRATIASTLNDEAAPAPRSSRRDRGKPASWQHTTIGSLLANETYAGRWVWNKRHWIKVPGTNRRIARPRPEHEWIVQERPDLAIVDLPTWSAANVKLRESAETYRQLTPSERRGTGRRAYLLSGILRCGACGALMAIHGGGTSGRHYYRCSAASSRGTCSSRRCAREEDVRTTFLETLRAHLTSPELLADVRAAIVEVLAEESQGASAQRGDRLARIARAEVRVRRLVDAVADGASPAIAAKLRELEAEIRDQRSALAELDSLERATETLPSVDEMLAGALDLDAVVRAGIDMPAARERLRAVLADGSIRMTAEGSTWVLTADVLPPMLVPSARSDHRIAGARFGGIRVRAVVAFPGKAA